MWVCQALAILSAAMGVVVGWAAKDVAHTLMVALVVPAADGAPPAWAIATYILYAAATTLLVLAALVALLRGYVAYVTRHEMEAEAHADALPPLASDDGSSNYLGLQAAFDHAFGDDASTPHAPSPRRPPVSAPHWDLV
jgi:hypothetical protein